MFIEFCLPVHNEEKILEPNILRLYNFCINKNYKFDWRIIIINNGSSDNTKIIAEKVSQNYNNKIKIESILKPGKGRALKTYWKNSQADILVYMDIDLAVSLDNIDDLINPIINNEVDLVIGSRLLSNSKVKRSFFRELSSRIYNSLSRKILGHKFYDMQCGFKAIRIKELKEYSNYIIDNNFFFDTELVFCFYYYGARIKEIPVDWEEERYDQRQSKLNVFKSSFSFVKNLFNLRKRFRL